MVHTAETKKKISRALKKYYSKHNKVMSEETKRKISESLKQQYATGVRDSAQSEETKKKISRTLKRKIKSGEIEDGSHILARWKKENPDGLKGISKKEGFSEMRREMMLGNKVSEETRKKMSAAQKGKVISKEAREKMSIARSELLMDGFHTNIEHSSGINMRSTWEIKVADWLDAQEIEWEYEPKYFKLPSGKRYLPDFYITEMDEFIEVKGYMDELSISKMNEFVKMGYVLHLIDGDVIDNIHVSEDTKWCVS